MLVPGPTSIDHLPPPSPAACAAGYVAYSNDEVRQQVGQQLAALQQQVLPGKAPQAPWKEHTQDAGFVMQVGALGCQHTSLQQAIVCCCLQPCALPSPAKSTVSACTARTARLACTA